MTKVASPRGVVRERVLQAALELFAEYGVSGTSLQMIADRVGVAKASVYYQFHTKEDIVLTLISPVFDDIARLVKIADAVGSDDGPTRRRDQRAGRARRPQPQPHHGFLRRSRDRSTRSVPRRIRRGHRRIRRPGHGSRTRRRGAGGNVGHHGRDLRHGDQPAAGRRVRRRSAPVALEDDEVPFGGATTSSLIRHRAKPAKRTVSTPNMAMSKNHVDAVCCQCAVVARFRRRGCSDRPWMRWPRSPTARA